LHPIFGWLIVAGLFVTVIYVLMNWHKIGTGTAPLNASGYSYPSSPGA